VLPLIAALNWAEVAVPLVAAAIGASSVVAVSRHLKRQELYVEAAQKINGYIDEAVEALKEVGYKDFNVEQAERARQAVSFAVFHSTRLESDEVTERLRVVEFVLWDMIDNEDRKGRLWAYKAIDDAMDAVVQFMLLPRLWPPRRKLRVLPPNRFPNTVEEYLKLAEPQGEEERPNWPALRKWVSRRRQELH
jgi:hypothetical protein